jgi:hypothetical protein
MDRFSDLHRRLAVFVDAGLLPVLPTRWQIVQGEIEMAPYVISTDATAEEGYQRSPYAHPLVRQLIILSHIGPDHLITGTALGAALESLCGHLILTFHRGMPNFDLQVVQTHPGGLDRLATAIAETLTRATSTGARRWRIISRLLLEPAAYLERFLGDDGWIARARRFDYATVASEGSAFPPEYFSLVAFLNYCAAQFPAHPSELGWSQLPAHFATLGTRRFREGRGFGWFERRPRRGPGEAR